ncbi:bifunctional adenosylcobinamide kinase/adenosylcobinamide-phosphate guanylyltransferase [Ensifer soli]|uniref:bifunctional adenosylcobinamide kinase/adenosylcobinamide-phosphate guanylyltransferase n=1 Tax=Ciceribacter sp. sgz301302 TaxID=3342379 RepID=UPI0035BB5DC2
MTEAGKGAVLVLGGARSGKSRFAEALALMSIAPPHYVATGQAFDDEMRARIDEHRLRRGAPWINHEEPLDLAGRILDIDVPQRTILVDCLTLWVTNLMMAERDLPVEFDRLCGVVDGLAGRVIFVSNEVGLGIVPENRMARDFRDHAGRLHQRVAERAAEVYFIAAGLPLKMKG